MNDSIQDEMVAAALVYGSAGISSALRAAAASSLFHMTQLLRKLRSGPSGPSGPDKRFTSAISAAPPCQRQETGAGEDGGLRARRTCVSRRSQRSAFLLLLPRFNTFAFFLFWFFFPLVTFRIVELLQVGFLLLFLGLW